MGLFCLEKYSKEFVQRPLYKLLDEKLEVALAGRSLESCASQCLDSGCRSFEFCESKHGIIESTCRTSETKAVDGVSMKKSPKSSCSVYIAKNEVKKVPKTKTTTNYKLAFGLGSFFFPIAAAIGFLATRWYTTKRQ